MNSNYNFFKIRFSSVFKKPKGAPNSIFKALSLLVLVSLFSINNSYGQCIQPAQYGTRTLSAVVSGSETITCSFAGEYGIWNGAVYGNTYTFSSTIGTDFLTISAAPGGPALAWGTQPLVYTSTVTGTLYVHVSNNSGCGTDQSCHDITGTTTALAPPGCTNGISYGTGALSAVVSGSSTIFCNFADEYGTWNGAVTGNTYNFVSTTPTDFLTIHTGTPNGPIVATGTQPLTWTSNTTGTIYVHVNTNSACGTNGACRDITGITTAIYIPGCTNGISYGTAALSGVVGGSSFIDCNYAGEYGTWNGAVTGNTYNFTSTIATDYLTIHTGTPNGPIVASGTQPLSWVSNTTGTIYVHVNTNSACGAQNTCRDITATTNTASTTSVLTPSTGSNSISCGQSVTLCTHAGCGNTYSDNVDGHTIINAANSAVVNINGTYNTEPGYDFITIYTGSGIGGAVAFGPVSGSGTINFTGNPGQTYTIRFNSDISITNTGYNLEVSYTGSCTSVLVPFSGNNSIACGNNSTLCSHAGCGLFYDNFADGFTVLNTLGVTTVNVNGSYDTESGYDFITIYEGSGTGGTILFGPVSGSGTINYTGLPGQTLTLHFLSDLSITSTGFSFAITYAGDCAVTAMPLCVASPSAPANGSTISACGVTLSWPFVAQAQSYDVYLNTGAGPATTLVSSAQIGTSYSPGLLAGSTSYSWRVVPKNSLGDAVGCSDFTFTTTAVPAAPTGLACYQTATFNETTCVWDVIGTQPISPATPNINVTIVGGCQPISGEWVNSGLLNGYYDFQYVYNGSTYHISYDGTQWLLWLNSFANNGFTNNSPSNGLYPPTTGWTLTNCGAGGTLTLDYPVIPTIECNQSYVFNNTTCVWDLVTGPPCVSINLKLFIEGYYDGASTMRPVKNNQDGVSPLTDVETVTVELHNAASPYGVLHTTTTMLKTNGTAVATFSTAPSGSFYISVSGANAIKTWSKLPQTVGGTTSYDFSTAVTQSYSDSMKNLGAGVFGWC